VAAYQDRLSTSQNLGKLTVAELQIDILTAADAIAFGRWSLGVVDESSGGFFTVQLKKIEGAWLFVTDHASTSG